MSNCPVQDEINQYDAHQVRAEREAERQAEDAAYTYEHLFDENGDAIQDILHEMADNESDWMDEFALCRRDGFPASAKQILYEVFNKYAMEYAERLVK